MSGVVTGTTGGGTATGVVEDVSPDGGVDVDIAGVLVSRVDEAVGVVDELMDGGAITTGVDEAVFRICEDVVDRVFVSVEDAIEGIVEDAVVKRLEVLF